MTMRDFKLLAATALAASFCAPAAAQITIVQPGAPGQSVRVISPAEASRIAESRFAPADVAFMQMMIAHHEQAVTMAALAPSRTNNPQLLTVAARITASQKDEARFMRDWLTQRRQPLTMAAMDMSLSSRRPYTSRRRAVT